MPVPTDPAGPVVAVCRGRRCEALLRLSDADDEALRAAVRRTRGAILISAPCVGLCHLAAVVLVRWRDARGWVPLSGMDSSGRLTALADWLPGPGPRAVLVGGAALPETLRGAYDEAASGVHDRGERAG